MPAIRKVNSKNDKRSGQLVGKMHGRPDGTKEPKGHGFAGQRTFAASIPVTFDNPTYNSQTVKEAMSQDVQFARFAMRHPKLMDSLCDPQHRHKMVDFIQAKAQNAVAYTFDPEISRLASSFTAAHPEVLAALAPDVRLPYPSMIIASCNRAMVGDQIISEDAINTRLDLVWTNATNTRISSIPLAIVGADKDFPKPSLLLIPQVYEFDIEPRQELVPPISPTVELYFKGILNADVAAADKPSDFKNSEHVAYAIHLLGSAIESENLEMSNKWDDISFSHNMLLVLKHMSMRQPFWPGDIQSASKHGILQRAVAEHQGHPRALYGLLALLNLRDRVSHVSQGTRKPGMYRHKSHTAPHIIERAVTILLPEAKALRLLKREAKLATGRRHKRHSVRGHWYSRIRDRECKHVYEQLDPNHYMCIRCESKRTFKKNHERGDASLGWVTHTQYDVEKR